MCWVWPTVAMLLAICSSCTHCTPADARLVAGRHIMQQLPGNASSTAQFSAEALYAQLQLDVQSVASDPPSEEYTIEVRILVQELLYSWCPGSCGYTIMQSWALAQTIFHTCAQCVGCSTRIPTIPLKMALRQHLDATVSTHGAVDPLDMRSQLPTHLVQLPRHPSRVSQCFVLQSEAVDVQRVLEDPETNTRSIMIQPGVRIIVLEGLSVPESTVNSMYLQQAALDLRTAGLDSRIFLTCVSGIVILPFQVRFASRIDCMTQMCSMT